MTDAATKDPPDQTHDAESPADSPELITSDAPPIVLHDTVLMPGDHLLEVELDRSATPEVFIDALRRMGFSDVVVDQSIAVRSADEPVEANADPHVERLWQRWREWGSPLAVPPNTAPAVRFRFAGRLAIPIRLLDTPWVRWIYAQTSTLDLFAPVSLGPFPDATLKRGHIYEVRFHARMRAFPTRRAICNSLASMGGGGFRPLKIIALQRNIRLPGLSGTKITLWYTMARWEGPLSTISSEEPFFFEVVKPVE